MRDVFHMTDREITVPRKDTYTPEDTVALWTALSTRLRPYMDIIRAETSKDDYDPVDPDRAGMGAVAGDWFSSHAAGLPVADTGLRAGIKAHRAMSNKTRSSVGSDPTSDDAPILKRAPPKRRLEFGDDDRPRQAGTLRPDISYHGEVSDYPRYPAAGSLPITKNVGYRPVSLWAQAVLAKSAKGGGGVGNALRRSQIDEAGFAKRLRGAAGTNASGNKFTPYNRIAGFGGRVGHRDYKAQDVLLEKVAWNQYIMSAPIRQWGATKEGGFTEDQKARRDSNLFENVPSDVTLFNGRLFDKNEENGRVAALPRYRTPRTCYQVHAREHYRDTN